MIQLRDQPLPRTLGHACFSQTYILSVLIAHLSNHHSEMWEPPASTEGLRPAFRRPALSSTRPELVLSEWGCLHRWGPQGLICENRRPGQGPFCSMNRDLFGHCTRRNRFEFCVSGNTKRRPLMASFPALWGGILVLILKTGPERVGDSQSSHSR